MLMSDAEHTIRYLPNQMIDTEKWDTCIASSQLPLIYATSVYLNGMCPHWDALIFGDYKAIMPLPWNRKWMVKYVYSPYFVIAGGMFGKEITEDIFRKFIMAVPKSFSYVDLDLNELNFFQSIFSQEALSFRQRRNTILSLHQPYTTIFSAYSSQAKRKLKKAAGYHFSVDKSLQIEKVIALYKQYYGKQDSVVLRFNFSNMIALLTGKLAPQTKTYTLSFPDGNICAFYLLLFDENYVYWLLGGSTTRGKEAVAFYHLTDVVIQDFANTPRMFRFEGSDHDGIHFFNQQFGGQTVLYPRININRLPWPFRHLKGE